MTTTMLHPWRCQRAAREQTPSQMLWSPRLTARCARINLLHRRGTQPDHLRLARRDYLPPDVLAKLPEADSAPGKPDAPAHPKRTRPTASSTKQEHSRVQAAPSGVPRVVRKGGNLEVAVLDDGSSTSRVRLHAPITGFCSRLHAATTVRGSCTSGPCSDTGESQAARRQVWAGQQLQLSTHVSHRIQSAGPQGLEWPKAQARKCRQGRGRKWRLLDVRENGSTHHARQAIMTRPLDTEIVVGFAVCASNPRQSPMFWVFTGLRRVPSGRRATRNMSLASEVCGCGEFLCSAASEKSQS